MCGIVGAVGERNMIPILLAGLKRLEYRGYDSAGLAVVQAGHIDRRRAVGKVDALADLVQNQPLTGSVGMAHTRWATHGKPSVKNAHPHMSSDQLALVHNGIIENYEELKKLLKDQGITCVSDTDSEVAAHLIALKFKESGDLVQAVAQVLPLLKGAYALVIMHVAQPDRLVAVRGGSPLVVGVGVEEHFVASDVLSLLPVTNRFIYLQEGDIAEITRSYVKVYNEQGLEIEPKIEEIEHSYDTASKGPYKHFMMKEIHEQSQAITDTFSTALDGHGLVLPSAFGMKAEPLLRQMKRMKIVACGTSYHAGMVAKYWLEEYAGVACDVEIASELRYRKTVVTPDTLFVVISQSGETADTLAALKQSKTLGYCGSLAICNVAGSALVREADAVFMTRAGIEMGVASTKAFTTQLTGFWLLCALLIQLSGRLDDAKRMVKELIALPELIKQALQSETHIQELALHFERAQSTLFLGRGPCFPIAQEGALKLKEISYIHAEAYPAGELKHGPLALVDVHMPVVVLMPEDNRFDKLKSNMEEVQARGGCLFIVTSENGKNQCPPEAKVIAISDEATLLYPILYTIPLQLLAYHVALLKGTDIDQPRNLAKSVTVE